MRLNVSFFFCESKKNCDTNYVIGENDIFSRDNRERRKKTRKFETKGRHFEGTCEISRILLRIVRRV